MSNFRKLKSKINKKFIKYGLKPVLPKGAAKDSKETTITIYPMEYDFIMDEYSNYGDIYMILLDKTSPENPDLFQLGIYGGFGIYGESAEYVEFNNKLIGTLKEILKFFDKLAHELSMDFTSINHLASLVYHYSIEKNK